MEAVQVIAEALVGGAAAAAKSESTEAVKSAFSSLRGLARRLLGQTDVPADENVAAMRSELEPRLAAVAEADLRELVQQARSVLAITDPTRFQQGHYDVRSDLRGAKGVQVNIGSVDSRQINNF